MRSRAAAGSTALPIPVAIVSSKRRAGREAAAVMVASVRVDGRPYDVAEGERLVFGREENVGVVGLDPYDMGISGVAGSIECDRGRWTIVNRSQKRPLFIEIPSESGRVKLTMGRTHIVATSQTIVLIPGLVYTHRIDMVVPQASVNWNRPTAGMEESTVVARGICSEADLDALTAIFSGFLASFPRRHPHPLTYRQAASLLGVSEAAVRKRIENLRLRLSRHGLADIGGDKALYDLADFVMDHGVIGPGDLDRLRLGPLEY